MVHGVRMHADLFWHNRLIELFKKTDAISEAYVSIYDRWEDVQSVKTITPISHPNLYLSSVQNSLE